MEVWDVPRWYHPRGFKRRQDASTGGSPQVVVGATTSLHHKLLRPGVKSMWICVKPCPTWVPDDQARHMFELFEPASGACLSGHRS